MCEEMRPPKRRSRVTHSLPSYYFVGNRVCSAIRSVWPVLVPREPRQSELHQRCEGIRNVPPVRAPTGRLRHCAEQRHQRGAVWLPCSSVRISSLRPPHPDAAARPGPHHLPQRSESGGHSPAGSDVAAVPHAVLGLRRDCMPCWPLLCGRDVSASDLPAGVLLRRRCPKATVSRWLLLPTALQRAAQVPRNRRLPRRQPQGERVGSLFCEHASTSYYCLWTVGGASGVHWQRLLVDTKAWIYLRC